MCLAFVSPSFAQSGGEESGEYRQAVREYDNGNYPAAEKLANEAVVGAEEAGNKNLIYKLLDVAAVSEISSEKYAEAETTLAKALRLLPENGADSARKAQIYLRLAWLKRSQRKFSEALYFARKAFESVPGNRQIEGEYCLTVGRIMYSSGFDISATIWLEKAEKAFETEPLSSAKLDVYRFLTLAWSSKMNYPAALRYAEKWISSAENSRFKQRHRQALFETATVLSAVGQKERAFSALKKGLRLSDENNDSYLGGQFLTSLLLHSLYEEDVKSASDYLRRLEELSADGRFFFEINLGKAVIAAFANQPEVAEKIFGELEKQRKSSNFILLFWKTTIAEKNENWERMLAVNQELLELTTGGNFREDLPLVYFNLAKAYFRLNQIPASLKNLEKSLACVEEIRQSENSNLSLGLLETYHDAYRLLAEIKLENAQESFELNDFLKARLLKDRINDAAPKAQSVASPAIRKTLEELSVKFINDQNLAAEIERQEKLVTNKIPDLNLAKPNLTELDKIPDFDDAAIVSYFFTLDKKLTAIVWEKGEPLKTTRLPLSETDADELAKTTGRKIKNLIFFKRDGKEIYDKLLKPLDLTARRLIIVPDKSLWKIPFQALSADGEKYLIEDKLVSYAPSVSILLEQIKGAKPNRQTLQAFANPFYDNRFLQYASGEAAQVAAIYDSKPVQHATVADFERNATNADILHFSMHAQIDSEQPLESFLAFKKSGASDDGRLTVEELLKIKLKKGSLAVLASCDTSSVLGGEGLVSLAWAMMGSGATTVVSAQWEANDKSTEIFTKAFYKSQKQGNSSVEAVQNAALELIRGKSNNMHEPYYWAHFTLYGDFR